MFSIIVNDKTDDRKYVTTEVATELIIEGLILDCIDELHSAVEYVNVFTPTDVIVNGDNVEGILKKIVTELERMSTEADKLAKDGATVDEMSKVITGEYFTFDNIKAFKIEVYGSVVAWKAAMVSDVTQV